MAFTNVSDGPNQLTDSAATIYTVAASTVFVIETIIVSNTDTASRTYTISIGTDAAGTRICPAVTIAANAVQIYDVHLPLAATTIVQAYADVTSKVNVTLGGYTIA